MSAMSAFFDRDVKCKALEDSFLEQGFHTICSSFLLNSMTSGSRDLRLQSAFQQPAGQKETTHSLGSHATIDMREVICTYSSVYARSTSSNLRRSRVQIASEKLVI